MYTPETNYTCGVKPKLRTQSLTFVKKSPTLNSIITRRPKSASTDVEACY